MRYIKRIEIGGFMKKYLILLSFLIAIPYANASESNECRSLDIREFGLIEDGNIGAAWTEAQLIQKFGPPCQIVSLGKTFTEKRSESGKTIIGDILEKKQFIYTGDNVNKTSIITIVNGVVVKKERIYD